MLKSIILDRLYRIKIREFEKNTKCNLLVSSNIFLKIFYYNRFIDSTRVISFTFISFFFFFKFFRNVSLNRHQQTKLMLSRPREFNRLSFQVESCSIFQVPTSSCSRSSLRFQVRTQLVAPQFLELTNEQLNLQLSISHNYRNGIKNS